MFACVLRVLLMLGLAFWAEKAGTLVLGCALNGGIALVAGLVVAAIYPQHLLEVARLAVALAEIF